MLNRDLFVQDPTKFTIPNNGVTVVGDPQSPEEWEVLRYELRSFACEGEYREGLERVLSTYLEHLHKPKQPAVWVSGFYGSGKSHLVRVLQYLWNDISFPDGATARGLTKVPTDVEADLMELTTWSKLNDEKWHDIFDANHVGPIDELDIGTDNKLLATLDEKPLSAWETEGVAVPTRMRQAREQAAKQLEPQAVRVQPRRTTLHSEEEVDAYLEELRSEILSYIDAGKPVIS